MNEQTITDADKKKAEGCLKCPLCSHARAKQRGLAYWFVKKVEGGICPQCKAYEKVYKHGKVYEPNLELTKKYRQWFRTYENLYPSLKDFNAALRATIAE